MKKFGFIDRSGSIVISPQFDYCYGFSEGLAAVEIDEVCGFIDKQGKFAIPLQYRSALGFSDGLAPICFKDSECGYIDKNGKIIIPLSFHQALEFSDGLAAVKTTTTTGFINTEGKWVITESDETMLYYWFSEGFCRFYVWDKKDAKDENDEGYLDTSEGYLGTAGEVVITPQFNETWAFSEGYAYVETKDGRNVFIDKTGQEVLELEVDAFCPYFSDGLVVVKIDGKKGYADKSGELVIEPQYDKADMFAEGLAAVNIDGKYGFIDKNGEWVIEPIFRFAQRFSEGLAAVITF